MLSSREQHRLLRDRADELIAAWDFPHANDVRRLVDEMARQCVDRSRERNAPLGGGAVAFGILQDEFDKIPDRHIHLARVLQFAVAYNAVTLVPEYGTKKQRWCLVELGGIPLLKYGLTLRRGGFLERDVKDLLSILDGANGA